MNVQNVSAGGVTTAPAGQLKTNRSLLKFILLSMVTLGIYGIVVMTSISTDVNIVASRYDGKKTMHFCLLTFLIAPVTAGIAIFVWYHKLSARIGNELQRRGISYSIGPSDYWLWGVLGCLIVVGPFIYCYKLFYAMNLLCENYNMCG